MPNIFADVMKVKMKDTPHSHKEPLHWLTLMHVFGMRRIPTTSLGAIAVIDVGHRFRSSHSLEYGGQRTWGREQDLCIVTRKVGSATRGTSMTYFYRELDDRERYQLEQVYLEQLDIQRWYAVAFLPVWSKELFITLN